MKNTVVVGAQFGDEGKAKITDLLAQKADFIVRYQGGCNAGHTVVVNNKKYKFHLIPSGILYENKTCFIGAGVVIHPESFKKEIEELINDGIAQEKFTKNLKINPLAHITMPYHIDLDGADEIKLGKNKIGTTKRGIGPTYSDKYARLGIRIEDLFDEEILSNKLDVILPNKNAVLEKIYGLKTYTKEEILNLCREYKELFAPYVCFDWQNVLRDAKKNKTILFEGAQGVLLDIDYGTYPYVTSSNPIGGGAAVGASMGVKTIDEVIGVFKAYITRVGEGDMVTEQLGEDGSKLQEIGAEFGVTTGRPRRCGFFDVPLAKYSVLVGGLTSIALTKLDVYDSFDEIKLCVGYQNKKTGEITQMYPTSVYTHKNYAPVWESYKGWNKDTTKCKTYEELPENAKIYLKRIEELLEIPIKIISVGPDRDQTIFID
ncbi:MAG: adenylosuccinate synthase [Cyanobacteria bacterium SIG30]|nr:adenylosuccinate synthase [Cyanobacteria bacterium SIG30]